MENQLYARWLKLGAGSRDFKIRLQAYRKREDLVQRFAWAIPSPEAIAWVAERCKKVVEIGAGRGYWAGLLAAAGVDIVAYEPTAIDGEIRANVYHSTSGKTFFDLRTGGPEFAAAHPDRTLFICWPPYDDPMAADCLKAYNGRRLLYVGEGWGGCNGNEEFWNILNEKWEEKEDFTIPRWECIRDWMTIYERKPAVKG